MHEPKWKLLLNPHRLVYNQYEHTEKGKLDREKLIILVQAETTTKTKPVKKIYKMYKHYLQVLSFQKVLNQTQDSLQTYITSVV